MLLNDIMKIEIDEKEKILYLYLISIIECYEKNICIKRFFTSILCSECNNLGELI